jgi:hypothetical protein
VGVSKVKTSSRAAAIKTQFTVFGTKIFAAPAAPAPAPAPPRLRVFKWLTAPPK